MRVAAVLLTGPALAAPVQKAVAKLEPTKDSKVGGTLSFTKVAGGLRVAGRIEGLTPGLHGFHVHEFGDCSSPDGSAAGPHFNPTGASHAAPGEAARHVGDLGNLEASAEGVAVIDSVDAKATLEGEASVLGRGVIVHANADDFKTQPTGNAGGRLACGVIGASKGE